MQYMCAGGLAQLFGSAEYYALKPVSIATSLLTRRTHSE